MEQKDMFWDFTRTFLIQVLSKRSWEVYVDSEEPMNEPVKVTKGEGTSMFDHPISKEDVDNIKRQKDRTKSENDMVKSYEVCSPHYDFIKDKTGWREGHMSMSNKLCDDLKKLYQPMVTYKKLLCYSGSDNALVKSKGRRRMVFSMLYTSEVFAATVSEPANAAILLWKILSLLGVSTFWADHTPILLPTMDMDKFNEDDEKKLLSYYEKMEGRRKKTNTNISDEERKAKILSDTEVKDFVISMKELSKVMDDATSAKKLC